MIKSESAFETVADETLGDLFENLEDALGEVADVDLQGGILTMELDAGGQYVINKHAPNRQIWMSSPFSGASHYDYAENQDAWIAARDGSNLLLRLAEELTKATGIPLTFG